MVPLTCTNHRKSGPNRQSAGVMHIWYRPTAHILGHLETIWGAEYLIGISFVNNLFYVEVVQADPFYA